MERYGIIFLLLFLGCTKDEKSPKGLTNKVVISTLSASAVTATTSILGGTITSDGGQGIVERGVCWNTTGLPTANDTKVTGGSGSGSYSYTVTGLQQGTNYSVRAFVKTPLETVYGSEIKFKTLQLATVTTNSITSITSVSANVNANISSDGGQPVTERGICWALTANPTVANTKKTSGTGTGSYLVSMTGLSTSARYYVRAYAITSAGTAYGNEGTFQTLAAPSISTAAISSITSSGAISGGNITSDGGIAILQRGVCWNTSPSPTTANTITVNGSGSGAFVSTLSNLQPYTYYYLRAYAINANNQIFYGNEIGFRTYSIPTVLTTTATNITTTTASSGGNVTSDGGQSITARGVCWNTTGNPSISDFYTSQGAGVGTFTSSLTNLSPNTTYYYRAYATNSQGTAYGSVQSFRTATNLATITTNAVSSITSASAQSGGTISSDGGAAVTQRGICWNTTGMPTINNALTNNGGGTGSFASGMTGLLASTTYYVRAYAVNSVGVSYGQQIAFNTAAPSLPVLSTTAITNITLNSAISGGNTISDGGAAISAKGVCWNTTGTPTVLNIRTNEGSGTANFASALTGLSPNTTYYVRAYATSTAGTGYGPQLSFITPLATPGLVSPASGASVICCNLTFSWGAVAGATGYEIQVSKSNTFSGTLYITSAIDCGGSAVPQITGVNARQVATTNYCMRPGTSSQIGTWYWRVRAFNGTNSSAWSLTRSYYYNY